MTAGGDAPSPSRIARRFIAGAICPRCSRIDRLYVFEREGIAVCACVDCGEIDDPRSDVAAESGAASPSQVVRILDDKPR